MSTLFLIGNGSSRSGFRLSRLRDKGLVIGCNLAYRDYPDFAAVITIDAKVSRFCEREFHGLHIFNDGFKTDDIYCNNLAFKVGKLPKLQDKLDSGKLAAYIAHTVFRADHLVMLGMDFGGPDLYSCKFESRPNFIEDWNELLKPFKEVTLVNDEVQDQLAGLQLTQVTYAALVARMDI